MISKMHFQIFWWEFLQNLPLGIGFFIGGQYWIININLSIMVMIFCSIISGILIRYTEKYIEDNPIEKGITTLGNIVQFSLYMIILNAYFWSSLSLLIFDIMLGLIFGFLLSFFQSKLENKKIDPKHTISFMISTPLILILFKLLIKSQIVNIFWGAIIITIIISFIISIIDYF